VPPGQWPEGPALVPGRTLPEVWTARWGARPGAPALRDGWDATRVLDGAAVVLMVSADVPEPFATELGLAQMEALDQRAHGAVENHDPIRQQCLDRRPNVSLHRSNQTSSIDRGQSSFNSRESDRSARTRPPVWQRAQ